MASLTEFQASITKNFFAECRKPHLKRGANLELDAKHLEKKMQQPLLRLVRVKAMKNFSRQSANQK
jgi:hypothetical protein